jgi:hypothetical protein
MDIAQFELRDARCEGFLTRCPAEQPHNAGRVPFATTRCQNAPVVQFFSNLANARGPSGTYVLKPIFYSSRASTWHKLLILFGVG